jgi:hypothetical protein
MDSRITHGLVVELDIGVTPDGFVENTSRVRAAEALENLARKLRERPRFGMTSCLIRDAAENDVGAYQLSTEALALCRERRRSSEAAEASAETPSAPGV